MTPLLDERDIASVTVALPSGDPAGRGELVGTEDRLLTAAREPG
jgi:hypothetical protein